jgi:hypothetical protein
MSAHSTRETRTLELTLSPGMGWRVLLPFSWSVGEQRRERSFAVLWTMMAVLPGGFWGAAALNRRRLVVWLTLASAIALAGNLIIPRAIGVGSPITHEVGASILGLMLGALLFRRTPVS